MRRSENVSSIQVFLLPVFLLSEFDCIIQYHLMRRLSKSSKAENSSEVKKIYISNKIFGIINENLKLFSFSMVNFSFSSQSFKNQQVTLFHQSTATFLLFHVKDFFPSVSSTVKIEVISLAENSNPASSNRFKKVRNFEHTSI